MRLRTPRGPWLPLCHLDAVLACLPPPYSQRKEKKDTRAERISSGGSLSALAVKKPANVTVSFFPASWSELARIWSLSFSFWCVSGVGSGVRAPGEEAVAVILL